MNRKIVNTYLQQRSALFDWTVFVVSVSLGFVFPTIGSFVLSAYFKWWMFSALIAYTVGAWLKHLPLAYRFAKHPEARREMIFAILLIPGHWCLLLLIIYLAEPAFSKLLGISSFMNHSSFSSGFIYGSMFLAGYITWMVYRSTNLKKTKIISEELLFRRELIADTLLMAAVSIFSFVLWEKGIMAMLSYKPVTSLKDVWFLFVILCFAFVLCYLPLRYLYLIEDHSSRQTWKRLLLIFAFLLLRSFFEIMKIV